MTKQMTEIKERRETYMACSELSFDFTLFV